MINKFKPFLATPLEYKLKIVAYMLAIIVSIYVIVLLHQIAFPDTCIGRSAAYKPSC